MIEGGLIQGVLEGILFPGKLMNYRVNYYFTCLAVFLSVAVYGQTIPLSDQLMQDYTRIRQLNGLLDSNVSFTVRPVDYKFLNKDQPSNDFDYSPRKLVREDGFLQFAIFPLSSIQQINTHRPYGWNDGLMIPAKGFQQYISAGFFLKAGPLTIQAKPEFIYASNPEYLDGNDVESNLRYTNFISPPTSYGADLPAYFEKANFSMFGIGQSSIRLNLGPVSAGISNENLWWGPGRRNSLLMSNSSRGFKHITINTVRPVYTPVGSFEGQIIAGHLENSNSPLNATKQMEWRYLSGMALSYQPKWVPGLFLGLTRVFQMYNTEIDGVADYIPLFQPFEKKRTEEDSKNRDQLTSIFARFLFKEANAEVYAELARNDHSFNLRDFVQEPQHSRAYLFGFQKLVNLPAGENKLLFAVEVTQLSQPINRVLRNAGTWYVHNINQGYTNFGEVIGAGIGPGANLQTFEFSWINGLKKIGVQVERFEHNKDYYQLVIDSWDTYDRQWVDFSGGVLANWNFGNLLVKSQISGIQSFNYIWQTGIADLPQKNTFNINASLGLHYYFK